MFRVLAAMFLLAAALLAVALPEWRNRAPLPQARQEVAVAFVRGEVFVIGGITAADIGVTTVRAHRPKQNTWRDIADLPVAVHHSGVAVVGNRLFAVGGLVSVPFQVVADVFEYDFVNDQWLPRAPMISPRGAAAVSAWNGKIYVAGGLGPTNRAVASFDVYDTATDSWTALPDLTFARDHCGGAAIQGHIFVVAGRETFIRSFRPVTEIYNIAAGTWSTGAPIPTPRAGVAAAVVDKKIYVLGGEGNIGDPNGIFHEVEAYDPLSDNWSALPPMAVGRHGIGAASLYRPARDLGFILVPGGATSQGIGAVSTNDLFIFRP